MSQERLIIYYDATLAQIVADEAMRFQGLVKNHSHGGISRGLLRGLAIPIRLWRLFWEYVEEASPNHTLWEGALYGTVVVGSAALVTYLVYKGTGRTEFFSMAGLKGTWELSAITDGVKLAAKDFKALLPEMDLPRDIVVTFQVRCWTLLAPATGVPLC